MGKFVNTVLKTNSVVSNFVLSGWEAFAAWSLHLSMTNPHVFL
jgi:hypothetical protein